MLLRTLTPTLGLLSPPTGATTTGVVSCTEIGGPTASGRSDCPRVGSRNLTLATAMASLEPCSVEKLATACTGYGGHGRVTSFGSLMVYTVSVSGLRRVK